MSAGRWNTNKQLFVVHGWLGLNFGLVLFIVCLSGTFAVVSHEIDWLLHPELRVTPQESRVSWGTIYENVRRRHPDERIVWIAAPLGSRFACEVLLEAEAGRRRVSVNPYSGEVQGTVSWFNTQRFFRDFHRRFFWYTWQGVWLVCAFAFVLLAAAGTGLLFYKRWWAKLFTLRFLRGWRTFWSDLHRLAGVWTLLFAVLIALTGVWYFVEIPLGWMVRDRSPAAPRVSTVAPANEPMTEPLSLDACIASASRSYPQLRIKTIWFPARPEVPLRIEGQADAWLVRNRANKVFVDPYTAEVLGVQRAENLSPLARWVDTADPLHFGDFGGLISKLVWFVFGLALSALMPTGAYLWVRRARQMTVAAEKRLDRQGETLSDKERLCLLRCEVKRQTGAGLLSTTGIALLATWTTWQALREQVSRGYPTSPAVLVFCGAFVVAVALASVLWYRFIWLATPALTRPPARATSLQSISTSPQRID